MLKYYYIFSCVCIDVQNNAHVSTILGKHPYQRKNTLIEHKRSYERLFRFEWDQLNFCFSFSSSNEKLFRFEWE